MVFTTGNWLTSNGQGPMEDKAKPMEEAFFCQLYFIFPWPLTDGS
jgi:hypothetical protein